MGRAVAAFCRRFRKQRGFGLGETVFSAAVAAAGAALLCLTAARCLNSWQNLQEEMQLQEAARHILTFVEVELAYGAVHINVQNQKKLSYQTTNGNKKVVLYCDNDGLYQSTTTGSGTGINPLSLENITLVPWSVKKISDRALSVKLTLCTDKRTRSFQRFIYCYNGEVVEDE